MKPLKRALASLWILLLVLALFTACDTQTEPEPSSYDVLTNYMVENNLDLPDILNSWIISADQVVGNEDSYYIIDIRAQDDYNTGHIPAAVNSTLGDILAAAENNNSNKPILVVCYSGQSAAHGVVALRLSGYADAKTLKFGMSSWHSDFDLWTSNCGNAAQNYPDSWTTAAPATPDEFEAPGWGSSSEDGSTILAERVQVLLGGGFKGVTADDVLSSPDVYFVNNYWPEAAWSQYGHIAGAYRLYGEDLTLEGDGLKSLDSEKTIVTYCWTGQTSSMVTAYLTVLGYDAKSLKFGVNGMIYPDLQDHKWSDQIPGDYTYE